VGWISAAAIIIFAFIAGWYFNESQNKNKVTAIQKETVLPENKKPETAIVSTDKDKTAIAVNPEITESKEHAIISETHQADNKLMVASMTKMEKEPDVQMNLAGRISSEFDFIQPAGARISKREELTELAQETTSNSESELSEAEKSIIADNTRNLNAQAQKSGNWKMGMSISPGYASHVTSHSESYSQNMTYTGNHGNANLGGGFSVQYKTGKRWSVESGAYYTKNGQKSEPSFNFLAMNSREDVMADVPGDAYFSNAVTVSNGNMQMNSTAGVISLNKTPKGAEVSGEFDASGKNISNSLITSGEFSQVFEFVEIPLFVRYHLIDQKFGVDLVGGLNAGIVVGNDAYIDNEYGLQNVGKTEDISPLNVSGTLGLGLNYALGKHFSLAFEPRFNYYLNSINSNPNVDFRPYRIGFYSGVYYEF